MRIHQPEEIESQKFGNLNKDWIVLIKMRWNIFWRCMLIGKSVQHAMNLRGFFLEKNAKTDEFSEKFQMTFGLLFSENHAASPVKRSKICNPLFLNSSEYSSIWHPSLMIGTVSLILFLLNCTFVLFWNGVKCVSFWPKSAPKTKFWDKMFTGPTTRVV